MGCTGGKEAKPAAAPPAPNPANKRKKSLAPTMKQAAPSPDHSVDHSADHNNHHHHNKASTPSEKCARAVPIPRPPILAVNLGDIAKEAADLPTEGVDEALLAEYDLCAPAFDMLDDEDYDKAFTEFLGLVKKRNAPALSSENGLVPLLGLSAMHALGNDAWSRMSTSDISETQRVTSEYWLKKRLQSRPENVGAALLALYELDRMNNTPKHDDSNYYIYLGMAMAKPHPLVALRHVTAVIARIKKESAKAPPEKKLEDDIEKRVCMHLMGRLADDAHTRVGAKAGRYVWKYYDKGADGFERNLRKAERILEYGMKYELGPFKEFEQALEKIRQKIAEEEPPMVEESEDATDDGSGVSAYSCAESNYGSGADGEEGGKKKRRRRKKHHESSRSGRRPSLMRDGGGHGGGGGGGLGGSMRGRRPSLGRQDSMQSISRQGSMRGMSPRGGAPESPRRASRAGGLERQGSMQRTGSMRGDGGPPVSPRRGSVRGDDGGVAPSTPRRGGGHGGTSPRRGKVSDYGRDNLEGGDSDEADTRRGLRREGSIRREGSVRRVSQRGDDIRSQLRAEASHI